MQLRSLLTPLTIVGIVATIIYSERVLAPPVKDGKVHILYWEKWTSFEGDAIKATVDEFNRSQNKIFVDLLTVSGIQDKTLLAVAGGDPPDVAGLYGPNVAQYVDDNAVLNLDDYCQENGISESQYVPIYWKIGHYRGHQYALPSTPASTALHYNKAMFREIGIDPEKPPQTLEEMDAIATKMTTYKNGKLDKTGFMPAEPGWWNWGWGYLFGGTLWDGKDKITANSPENVRAFEWVASYSKKFGATNLQSFRSGLGNFSSPQNGFLDGKVGMELQGVWMYNFISKYSPKMESPVREWAAVQFPHPADRPDLADVTFADEDVLVLPRGCPHPKEAFEFIKYIQSQKGMEMLCGLQRKNSPLLAVSEKFYKNSPNPFIRLFVDMPKSKNTVIQPMLGIWPEYTNELSNAFDEISLIDKNSDKTVKEILDKVQERMQPKLDEYLKRQRQRDAAESKTPGEASRLDTRQGNSLDAQVRTVGR